MKKYPVTLKIFLTIMFLMCIFYLSYAETDEEEKLELEEVVITATKTESVIEDVPVSVEIMTEQEIEDRGAEKLGDILDEAVSVYFSSFRRDKSSVGIRGFDTNQTLILVDGKRIAGEPTYSYEIDRVTLENIERIEIVRGPVSPFFGSEALGGVINIITKRPERFSVEVTPEVSSYFEGGCRDCKKVYQPRLTVRHSKSSIFLSPDHTLIETLMKRMEVRLYMADSVLTARLSLSML